MRKTLKPSDICVLIDTREQLPLAFPQFKTEQASLPTGDYSVKGLERRVAIERKSLQDFIGCVGRERERFDREIQRLLAYQTRAVVIEANLQDIIDQKYRGQVHPNAARSAIAGWGARGVPIYLVGNRENAIDMISRIIFIAADRAWREMYEYCESVFTTQSKGAKSPKS